MNVNLVDPQNAIGAKMLGGAARAPQSSASSPAASGFTPTQAMGMAAASGLIAGIGAAYAQQATGYYQQAGYSVQAQEALRLAGLRADKAAEYGEAAFKRNLLKIEYDSLNYKIQANNQLKTFGLPMQPFLPVGMLLALWLLAARMQAFVAQMYARSIRMWALQI